MNKDSLIQFIDNNWPQIELMIEKMVVEGFENVVDQREIGELYTSAEVLSRLAYKNIMELMEQYELEKKSSTSPTEQSKYLYLLYDWRNEEVIYKTCSQLQMYAQVGKMQLDGVYEEDMHVIMVNLEEVE